MTAPVSSTAERDSVRKLCTRFHQAYRGLRLYPADHPTSRHALDEFAAALTTHLNKWGPLQLAVEEDRLLLDDQTVYTQEDQRGNLAFMMFRDGIRFLVFQPGIARGEVEALVDCLSHSDDLASIEYDLSTALWERDLEHIEYEVVDPFLGVGNEGVRQDAMADLRDTVVRRLGELSATGAAESTGVAVGVDSGMGQEEGPIAGGDGPESADSVTGAELGRFTLTPEEMERGEQAVAELSRTVLSDFALVLLEIAGAPSDSSEAEDVVARSLAMVSEQYLDAGDIDGFAFLVERLQSLEAAGRRTPAFGRLVVGSAMTAERLARLIEQGDQGTPEQAARVEALLTGMRNWVFPALLETLAESSDKGVRKTVLALLDVEGGVPVEYLWPLMDDPRWYVVRNAVQLATSSGDPALATHLERLLRHPDARVRREVIRSLHSLGDNRTAVLLARALQDDDSSVRTLAAHGLVRHGNRGQIAALQTHVESRDFEARPAEEVTALLLAYASLGGEATVDTLNKLWRRRIFGNRSMAVRVAAVQALGAVASPSAREALSAAAKCGEAQLQRAAFRALGGAWSGTGGSGA